MAQSISESLGMIPRKFRISMIAATICGMAAYGYIFLNPIFTFDGTALTMNYGINTVVGGAMRLTPFTSLWSFFQGGVQNPWFAGILSLFFYGLSAYLVCDTCLVESDWSVVFVSAIMTVSPPLIVSQMYGVGGFLFAVYLFFSCLAAWLVYRRFRYKWFCFAAAAFLVVTTYTGYIGWTIVVILLRQVRDMITGDRSSGENFSKINSFVIILTCVATALDVLICRTILFFTESTAQARVETLMASSLGHRVSFAWESLILLVKSFLPPQIVDNTWNPDFSPHYSSYDNWFVEKNAMMALFYIVFALAMYVLFQIAQQKKTENDKSIFVKLFVYGGLLFLSMDPLSFFTNTHVLLHYGHLMPWMFMIIMLDLLLSQKNDFLQKLNLNRMFRTVYMSSTVCLVVFTLWSNILSANVGYMRLQMLYRSADLLASRLTGRIETLEEFDITSDRVYICGVLGGYLKLPYEAFNFSDGQISVSDPYGSGTAFFYYMMHHVGAPIKYVISPENWGVIGAPMVTADAEEHFDRLNTVYEGKFDDNDKKEFISKYNSTEDFPSTNNYFVFNDNILVYRLINSVE